MEHVVAGVKSFWTLLLLALALVACDEKENGEASDCAAQIQAYTSWTQAMLADEKDGLLVPAVALPEMTLAPWLGDAPGTMAAPAPLIRVRKTVIQLDWERLSAQKESLSHDLAQRLERLGSQGAAPTRVNLALDQDAPWRLATAALAGAEQAGVARVDLLLTGVRKPLKAKTPRSSVHEQVQTIMKEQDASQRQTRMAGLLSIQMMGCPAMKEVFMALGKASAKDKSRLLLEGALEAVKICRCQADLLALQEIFATLLSNEPPTLALPIKLGAAGAQVDKELTIAGDKRWSEVHTEVQPLLLTAAKETVRFMVQE